MQAFTGTAFHVALRAKAIERGALSTGKTPFMVRCPTHGAMFLTEREYDRQMDAPNAGWRCPACGSPAIWDDDNYEGLSGAESA